jgi:DNA-binding beta-propeller fold protein YncE
MKLPATLIVALVLALCMASAAWGIGDLSQERGKAACTSETGGGGPVLIIDGNGIREGAETKGICRNGRAVETAEEIAISPDGRNVYATSYGGLPSTISIFDRDRRSGRLTQKRGPAGCVSEDEKEVEGACAHGRALDEPQGVVVSPDGRQVYITGFDSNALTIFDRNPRTGAIEQRPGAAGCLSHTGTDGHGGKCQKAASVHSPGGVTISPDGRSVYVSSVDRSRKDPAGRSISVFDRDPSTGALVQKPGPAGCISGSDTGGFCQLARGVAEPIQAIVSPDGRNVYVSSFDDPALAVFDRDPATGALVQKLGPAGCFSPDGTGGACQPGRAMELGRLAFSPDGRNLYLLGQSSDGLVIFDRDLATGTLVQKAGATGCLLPKGRGGCGSVRAIKDPQQIAVSPDGKSAYVTSYSTNGVVIFDRDPGTGALAQRPGAGGCIVEGKSGTKCRKGRALRGAIGIVVSPDGRNVYVASITSSAVTTLIRSTR